MNLIIAPRAKIDLNEIWQWNAVNYSAEHGDFYLELLWENIFDLPNNYLRGTVVPNRPYTRTLLIQQKPRRHGHFIIYDIVEQESISVLRIVHSARDWQKLI